MPYWRYIKKTNTRVDAYAAQIAKESEDVQALMTEQMTDLTGKMQAQKDAASADVSAADAASMAGFEKVMTKVADELAASCSRRRSHRSVSRPLPTLWPPRRPLPRRPRSVRCYG